MVNVIICCASVFPQKKNRKTFFAFIYFCSLFQLSLKLLAARTLLILNHNKNIEVCRSMLKSPSGADFMRKYDKEFVELNSNVNFKEFLKNERSTMRASSSVKFAILNSNNSSFMLPRIENYVSVACGTERTPPESQSNQSLPASEIYLLRKFYDITW